MGGASRTRWATLEEGGSIVVAIDAEKLDGRRARSLRTRDAIVTALLDLVASGDVAPTAQRVADQAGVSVRSVYQHFVDVEGLYAVAVARTFASVREASTAVDPSLPLPQRVDAFVEARSAVLERLLAFHRSVRLVEPTSERVRGERTAMDRWERDRLGKVFAPELRRTARPRRAQTLAALDALTSAETWDRLRRSGQSARSARQIVRDGVSCMLGVR